jgi:hypothetical protein
MAWQVRRFYVTLISLSVRFNGQEVKISRVVWRINGVTYIGVVSVLSVCKLLALSRVYASPDVSSRLVIIITGLIMFLVILLVLHRRFAASLS